MEEKKKKEIPKLQGTLAGAQYKLAIFLTGSINIHAVNQKTHRTLP